MWCFDHFNHLVLPVTISIVACARFMLPIHQTLWDSFVDNCEIQKPTFGGIVLRISQLQDSLSHCDTCFTSPDVRISGCGAYYDGDSIFGRAAPFSKALRQVVSCRIFGRTQSDQTSSRFKKARVLLVTGIINFNSEVSVFAPFRGEWLDSSTVSEQ